MRPNKPAKADEQAALDAVRMNVAFENMVQAVLAGAAAGAALRFAIGFVFSALNGSLAAIFVSLVLKTLTFGFLVFLIGFIASVLIGAPMFSALERNKRRGPAPYIAAGAGVAGASLLLIGGGGAPGAVTAACIIVSASVIVFVFVRRMRPVWRAAAAREAQETAPSNVFRLH